MPKNIYTERDIEELARRGSTSLVVDDNTLITDLAEEKAKRLGISLIKTSANPPCAPVRPYLSATPRAISPPLASPAANPALMQAEADLLKRVQAAVMASVGDQIEPATLEMIIQRVLKRVSLS